MNLKQPTSAFEMVGRTHLLKSNVGELWGSDVHKCVGRRGDPILLHQTLFEQVMKAEDTGNFVPAQIKLFRQQPKFLIVSHCNFPSSTTI